MVMGMVQDAAACLLADPKAPAVHYMGLYLNDDTATMDKNMSNVAGQFMTQWYDNTDDAGPPRRPRSSFGEPIPTLEVLTISDQSCKSLQCHLKGFQCFPYLVENLFTSVDIGPILHLSLVS